jgi:hypothetical protein
MATDQLNHFIEEAEQLSDEDLQAAHARIQEILNDRKWDKTLASPESIAYEKKVRAKIEADITTGNIKNYISDNDLEELF